MSDHRIGTREEWQAARDELAKLEAEHAKLDQEVTQRRRQLPWGRVEKEERFHTQDGAEEPRRRRQLPWVRVEKEYRCDTEDGQKTLGELFDGRSQLLAYNIMYGPDYTIGACPGCTSLGDELEATRVHLKHQDVALICLSRAPIERLNAYKERMGWTFPYVSTYENDFVWDIGLAMTPEQAEQIPEVQEMIAAPPAWLQEWAEMVGAELKDGLRENPSFHAFARENGTVYHTYSVSAPNPFVAPYHAFLQ